MQEKNGYFLVVIYYKDGTGKRKQKSISTGFPSFRGNRRKEKQIGTGKPKKRKITMLSEPVRHYIDLKRPAVQPSTLVGYEHLGANQLRLLNDKPLSDIADSDINDSSKTLRERGDSDNTIRNYIILLKEVLKHVGSSFRAAVPAPGRIHGKYYTLGEVHQLLEEESGYFIKCARYITSYLGMRSSEISGLKWGKSQF